jgi:Flp pilus assembly pilin Flp
MMLHIQNFWVRHTAREEGAGFVEYVLLLALIALVCIAAVGLFGSGIGNSMSRNAGSVAGA